MNVQMKGLTAELMPASLRAKTRGSVVRSVCLAAVAAILGGSLSGCAGVHLYNAENDATAAAVLEAGTGLDLGAVIKQERQNKAKLLSHEISAASDFSIARRDLALTAMLEDTGTLSEVLENRVEYRLLKLLGVEHVGQFPAGHIWAATENLKARSKAFQDFFKVPAPSCEIADPPYKATESSINDYTKRAAAKLGKTPESVRPLVEEALRGGKSTPGLQQRCAEFLEAVNARACKEDSLLGKACSDWKAAQEETTKQEAKKKQTLADLEKRLNELKELLKKPTNDSAEEPQKKIEEGVGKVRDALGAIKKVPLAQVEAASDLIDGIDSVLSSAARASDEADGTAAPDTMLKIAAQLPSLAGRLATIDSLSKTPPVAALVLEKQRLLYAKLDAERRVQSEQHRVSLRKARWEARIGEIKTLIRARQLVTEAVSGNGNKPIKASDLLSISTKEAPRRYLVEAVAAYLSTFTGPRRDDFEIEYRLIDLDHSDSLDRSQTALALWETSIQQPVTVLAAYHAAGIKPEDIIEILKAAGLFTIGAGVND
tara:strand:+ start:3317 stop:4948 length:1632 start_codon:yes stop_codon:yes gene_type:complete